MPRRLPLVQLPPTGLQTVCVSHQELLNAHPTFNKAVTSSETAIHIDTLLKLITR